MMYFKNVTNLEDLKKQYRKLAMEFHPDRGGSEEVMQKINSEYERLFADLKTAEDMEDDFRAIIDALLNFDLTIEIIGTWIWVSGDTYSVKAQLKELGFKWASKKKAWYWHPEGYVKMHKKNFTLDEIKNMHGSQTLKTSSKKLLLV